MNAVATANLVGITGIVRRLVLDGALNDVDARQAMERASAEKKPVHVYLQEHRLATPVQITAANSMEFGIPQFDASVLDFNQAAVKLVSEELIQKHQVLPLFKRGNRLFVATSDPTNSRALDEIKFAANASVEPILVDEESLKRAIDQGLAAADQIGSEFDDESMDGLEAVGADGEAADSGSVDATKGDDTPVVRFVNKMLVDAIKRGASDIHFEPYETEYRVRFRIDGVLKIVAKAPVALNTRLAARLKVMASLDIAEKRVPQDGRIKLKLSKTKEMDYRVSTLPTLFGEKIVLRLLDSSSAKLGIDKLGYEDDQKQLYLNALSKPYGMILVTGPTGSGKTVSLYTGLNILNTEGRNISTAEDPVEIRVPGINQVQQNTKRGMTFAAALRSFLRQDPDVIMVGEIRDIETAEIAIKAAQTGHLVLSTLHTNDAPQTISRLMNMGVAPYNITSSVSLVIAQRLARRLCTQCKRPVNLPDNALLAEGFTPDEIAQGITIYEAVGCSDCTEGYKGRVGVYQVMPMSEEIQKIVLAGGNAMAIAEAAEAAGVPDLRKSALKKVKDGLTSLAEINRVTKD
ncbi:type IV-A pilus assembly ATPase PilB [Coralloluteibacterium stylophorae]|uniref:Type IV-A pilus assembly ATPase PilB n=3 Tax=Coralloluteibacterium stylophorae TaxID=1776034 RepID=A0AAP2FZ84_9GAMM|nr:type IV-A pilus assembly ATPase PilB [Coralloluteibacterium stylophorae]MBS7457727.1 type IV-A pilus assembly ATPase PilB [Coralloluteibacterium stylophorae]